MADPACSLATRDVQCLLAGFVDKAVLTGLAGQSRATRGWLHSVSSPMPGDSVTVTGDGAWSRWCEAPVSKGLTVQHRNVACPD